MLFRDNRDDENLYQLFTCTQASRLPPGTGVYAIESEDDEKCAVQDTIYQIYQSQIPAEL
jgi:hypothetical protein